MEDGENTAYTSYNFSNLCSSTFLKPAMAFHNIFHILIRLEKEKNTRVKKALHSYPIKDVCRDGSITLRREIELYR